MLSKSNGTKGSGNRLVAVAQVFGVSNIHIFPFFFSIGLFRFIRAIV